MFKTSRDRGYLAAGVFFLAVCCAIFQPVVFFGVFAGMSVLGAVGCAFVVYDWIISADEVLAQEAEYRRERYQMTPTARETLDSLARKAEQRASWGRQDMD